MGVGGGEKANFHLWSKEQQRHKQTENLQCLLVCLTKKANCEQPREAGRGTAMRIHAAYSTPRVPRETGLRTNVALHRPNRPKSTAVIHGRFKWYHMPAECATNSSNNKYFRILWTRIEAVPTPLRVTLCTPTGPSGIVLLVRYYDDRLC